jgi:hypothetical protein
MTPENELQLQNALKNLAKAQHEGVIASLSHSEHILALETVLFSLDSRARELFEKQLALEHEKNRKRREELGMLLQSMRSASPKMPSLDVLPFAIVETLLTQSSVSIVIRA